MVTHMTTCNICDRVEPKTDVTGRRIWRNADWCVLAGVTTNLFGSFEVYPTRHVPQIGELSEQEFADYETVLSTVENAVTAALSDVLVEVGIDSFDLGGFNVVEMQGGHFCVRAMPAVYLPLGLESLREAVGADIASAVEKHAPKIDVRYKDEIRTHLNGHEWSFSKGAAQ